MTVLPSALQEGGRIVFDPLEHLLSFEERFPAIFSLFRKVGIHPSYPTAIINPYTGKICSETFTNIGEHCIAVAYCAEKIVTPLVETETLDKSAADHIIERALVHDLTKPFEIMRRNAKAEGYTEEVYSTSAYQRLRPLLVGQGYSEELAGYLIRAGDENGHNSLAGFIRPHPSGSFGLVRGKLAEKIIHLADDMTYSGHPVDSITRKPVTLFVTPHDRIGLMKLSKKYPFLWKEGLGIDSLGRIIPLPNTRRVEKGITVLGTYASLQKKVSFHICEEIRTLIAPHSKKKADQFVKALVLSANRFMGKELLPSKASQKERS
jgi:hypothetical protein